ncbi:hypothetical protein EDD18DRAFT_1113174 [Armillaria luteobubalina]|uniref:Uncharacterized protein n=1 Tax=Armillaria luteobubalina TaxID=153913 RepID=A0AA39PBA1_9AGAR|nr:hypothetical protein EDD18DRAFT_1113174 [Armillaria luteobubalina]
MSVADTAFGLKGVLGENLYPTPKKRGLTLPVLPETEYRCILKAVSVENLDWAIAWSDIFDITQPERRKFVLAMVPLVAPSETGTVDMVPQHLLVPLHPRMMRLRIPRAEPPLILPQTLYFSPHHKHMLRKHGETIELVLGRLQGVNYKMDLDGQYYVFEEGPTGDTTILGI